MGFATAARRLRVSAWADVHHLRGTDLREDVIGADGRPVVDDISLRRTLQAFDDRLAGVRIGWDSRALDGCDEANTQEMTRLVDMCHRRLGVQVLIGFGTARVETTWLGRWLNLADPFPNCDALAARILAFCDANCPGYDGLSFDVHGDPLLGGEGREPQGDEPDLACFEASHHRAITVHERRGRIYPCFLRQPTLRHDTGVDEAESLAELGYRERDFFSWRVTRNLTQLYQTLARKLTATPQLPTSIRRVGYDRLVTFTAEALVGSPPGDGRLYCAGAGLANAGMRMNDYRAVRRDRNLIVRAVSAPGESHQEIADWVQGRLGASKSFQLGVKDTVYVSSQSLEELGARGLGVVFTPPGSRFCRRANETINPSSPAAEVAGQPVQAPLNQRAIELLRRS